MSEEPMDPNGSDGPGQVPEDHLVARRPHRSRLDSFTMAVMAEASRGKEGGPKGGASLVLVFALYAVPFFMSLLGIIMKAESERWFRGYYLVIICVSILGIVVTWKENQDLFGMPKLSFRGVLLVAAAIAGILGIVALLFTYIVSFFQSLDKMLVESYRARGLGLAALLLDTALLPALGEELLFRVLILSALLRIFGEATAVLVSAFLFAILHLAPVSFLHLSLVGILLGYVRIRSGSVYPCMFIHASYNSLITMQIWFSGGS